ncbi:MAG: quinolinate synthase NadA [Deltaproteobacteria bacterium]|nr:quinolinate synthase NadA [Deltaproteobacteria bacterium]
MSLEKLQSEVRRLLKEKNAILLAHNYQLPEIQDVADLTGDSLDLSVRAAKTDAEVIVFCGVRFMAETAAILCPDKTVILPRLDAGCEMADMIDADALRDRKASLPGVPVVTYVNSTAEVKAESDICCTSANAIKVVNSLTDADVVLMTPDQNLAQYTQRHTGKKIIYWEGYCPIHEILSVEDVFKAKAEHPGALFLAHPECRPEVIDLADAVRSTTGMLAFVREAKAEEFVIGTEVGLLYPLQRQNPMKRFYPASDKMVCEHMKLTRLGDVIAALSELKNVVHVPEEVRIRAKKAVDRMLAVPRD